MLTFDKIPKKPKAKWPKKVALNVDLETFKKWHYLNDMECAPADLVREPVIKLIEEAYAVAVKHQSKVQES